MSLHYSMIYAGTKYFRYGEDCQTMDLSVEIVDFFHIFRTKYAKEIIKIVGKKFRLGLIKMADSSLFKACFS